MSKPTIAHWIPVNEELPMDYDITVLVILRKEVPPGDEEEFERWIEFGVFEPGKGWSGNWDGYLGDEVVVTHWAPRPEFAEL